MGNNESISTTATTLPSVTDVTIPVQYSLMSDQHYFQGLVNDNEPISTRTLFTPPFFGTWSVELPNVRSPMARTGQFTVVDEDHQIAYVGYGTSSNGVLLSDLWALDLTCLTWREIKINHGSPKNGCRAVLYENNRKIFIFGGFLNGSYSNELQVIDIDTGIVHTVETSGDIPEGRSTPIMGLYEDKLFMWGGYNGQWPDSIHILDMKTMEWSKVHQNEKGRTSVPYVVSGNNIISYGGSHSPGLFVLDMNSTTVKIVETTGFAPPSDVMSAGMVRADNLIFYFGGKAKNSEWTILYALDVAKRWWFIFHVRPDGETVTLSDGNVSENGIFMLPRIHSFGVAYSRKNRAIVAFLGHPQIEPPHLFLLKIGEPLGYINLRNDILDMMKL